MLTPRELEVLDVVGEVMQERLQEVRKEYEGKLNDLQTKVAALEARPVPKWPSAEEIILAVDNEWAARFDALPPPPDLTPLTDRIATLEARPAEVTLETLRTVGDELIERRSVIVEAALDARFEALPPPVDLTPFTEKIAALEARAPEVTLETLRKMGDDLEEVIERRFAMLPPPPDLTPLAEKLAELETRPQHDVPALIGQLEQSVAAPIAALRSQVGQLEQRPEPDLAPLTQKIATLETQLAEADGALSDMVLGLRSEVSDQFTAVDHRLDLIPPPPDLAPLTEKVAALEDRPSVEEVLKLTQSAVRSGQADIIERLEKAFNERFAALPAPEKGAKGDPGDPGKSITVEDFRPTFEAAYAKHELETERRIMDLVQRTLDRVPIPKDGKDGLDGLGFDDLDVVQTGDRTIEIRYARGEKQKVFAFKFPWLIDRGVWKVGTAYEKGDVVTWGGSTWIVTCDNPSGKPKDGVSPDWRLMAKSGRDGKPGEPGLKGDPGKDAKPVREQPNGMLRGRSEP